VSERVKIMVEADFAVLEGRPAEEYVSAGLPAIG
jgi:hypothetical protein